jgi:SAM-dependent methyltransferase
MSMNPGERQVAPTLDEIRRDHTARYEFAARMLSTGSSVIDFACGIGYGARIMAAAGHAVTGYDKDAEAIAYGNSHYSHPEAVLLLADASNPGELPQVDCAVCFETIEHVKDPRPLLRALRKSAPMLLASVPNENVFPYTGQLYHYRHYTPGQFQALLAECGWAVQEWFCQEGDESEVEPGAHGRTVLVRATPCEEKAATPSPLYSKPAPPGHVAILGLGPSVRQFLELTKRFGGRRAFCDEVWGINALGDVFACDRVFHMDDVRVQDIRAAAKPDSNIAQMLKWLKTTKLPVVTSRAHPDYPSLEEFPLAEVLTEFPYGYFNSTAAYAIAYALYVGATKITCFGMDFTYPDAHDAEKGRACVEFWLGMAAARGVELAMPKTTSLMDAMNPQELRFYGYDTLELEFKREAGAITVSRTERTTLPTAEEIENNYCHQRHPNALVEAGEG